MKYYFQLLFRLFYREITDFNVHPLLVIAALIGSFVGVSELLFQRVIYPEYSYGALALFTTYLLGGKTRNEFIKNLFKLEKYRIIRWRENMLVIIPFLIFLIYKGYYIVPGAIIVLASLLSLYNKVGQSFYAIPTPFSKRPYEFTVGFRTYLLLFLLTYILTLMAIMVGNLNLGIFCLLLLFTICQYFYFKVEPLIFVWMHQQSAAAFIRKKTITAVLHSLLLVLPATVILVAFNLSNIHWILLALVVGILYSIVAAVVKYASYPDNPSMFFQILVAIGLFLPPLYLLLIPYFYHNSLKSLKPYLK